MSTRIDNGVRATLENRDNSSSPLASKTNNAKSANSHEESTESGPLLKHITSAMFATVLEEVIMAIRLLDDANINTKITAIMIDLETHIRKKFGVELPPVDEIEAIGNRSLESYEFKIVKMNKDRMLIMDVIIPTYEQLTLVQQYKPLIDKNQEIIERNKYYATLLTDSNKNKMRVKELRRYLRQLSIQNKSTIYETDVILDKLEKSIEDTSITEETRSRHVGNWQNARTEQHIQTVAIAESVCGDSIRYYRNRMEKELIVHTEIESLVNVTITDTMNKIQCWMEKYEKDSEAIDLKIQVKRNEYMDKLNTRIHLEETIQLHNKQMWDWTEFKRKRAEAQKYIADMTRCAIMVQAWWRGLLVRKQLGPFKVKKKKGGKKK